MKKNYTVQFLFYSLMVFNLRVNAENIESLKLKQVEMILQCLKENAVPPEDVELFQKRKMPDSETAKCFVACAYKSTGVMDDHGMMSAEGVNELALKFLSDDPERPLKAKLFIEACLSVNDVEVSDGDKGCERAALMFKCGQEKVPKFDFI